MVTSKIILFNTNNQYINTEKLTSACDKMKVETYFSDFNFCPYLFAYKDDKEVTQVNNLNIGAVRNIETNHSFNLITVETLENFIIEVFNLKFNNETTNSLF